MFTLLVDGYFERFIMSVSGRLPDEFKKEVYKQETAYQVILHELAKDNVKGIKVYKSSQCIEFKNDNASVI